MTAADCTLRQFKKAWFDGDRSDIDDETFQNIHLEYIDISGLTRTRELELNSQLYALQNRVERVKWLLYGLRLSVAEIGRPFDLAINDLKKLGHKIYWDSDPAQFEKLLQKIEGKEARYIMQLQEKEKELIDFMKAQTKGDASMIQTRQQFIKNEIELRRRGHYIKENETTVEEFALIMKTENETAEREALKINKK